MNCIFCNEPCFLLESGMKSHAIPTQREVWQCSHHPHKVNQCVKFLYPHKPDCEDPSCCPKEHFYATTIFWDFRQTMYQVSWLFAEDNLIVNSGGEEVVKLHPIPKGLTPENMNKKLSLWITFS